MKAFYQLAVALYSIAAVFMYAAAICQCVVYAMLDYQSFNQAVDVYVVSYVVTTIGVIVVSTFLSFGQKNYRPPEYQYGPSSKSEYQKNSIFGCVGAGIGIGMTSYYLAFGVACLRTVKLLIDIYDFDDEDLEDSTDYTYYSYRSFVKATKFIDIICILFSALSIAACIALIISEVIQIVKRQKMPESEFVRKPQVQQNIIYTTVQQPMQQPYPQYQGYPQQGYPQQAYQQNYQQPQYQQQMPQQQMCQQQPQQSYQSSTNQQDANVTVTSVKTVTQRNNNVI